MLGSDGSRSEATDGEEPYEIIDRNRADKVWGGYLEASGSAHPTEVKIAGDVNVGAGVHGEVVSHQQEQGVEAPAVGEAALSELYREGGLEEIGLDQVEVERGVLESGGKGGAVAKDYLWACSAWESEVRPKLAEGCKREYFEEVDSSKNAAELRKLAFVYDLFLGGDRIVLSEGADGVFTITNGRHRLEAAKILGIERLPARVLRR